MLIFFEALFFYLLLTSRSVNIILVSIEYHQFILLMSPRTKEQNEEIRRERRIGILSAAIRLFAAHGFEATSISMIAAEAKMAKGLLYAYFESKESLVYALIDDYMFKISKLLNPDNDNEITSEEMADFIENLRRSIEQDNEYWRLYAQLSLRPDILEYFMRNFNSGGVMLKQRELLRRYFAERFEDAETEEFYFSSLIKGFTLQYAFAPELIPKHVMDSFIERLKGIYVIPKAGH
jgi:AcrR family transcriptional regulator